MEIRNLLFVPCAFVVLVQLSCVEQDSLQPSDRLVVLRSTETSVEEIQAYHDAILLGTMDLLVDPFFVQQAISLARTTFSISEYTDYYAYYEELAEIFNGANRDLLAEMISSAANHSSTSTAVDILSEHGLSFVTDLYDFSPRLFLINLDETTYQNPTQIARLSFSNWDLGDIPLWTSSGLSANFTLDTVSATILEQSPIWVVSSGILDITLDKEVDVIGFEAGGKKKCEKSTTTTWCVNSGKQCKCVYGDPIDQMQANFDLIEAFINGELGEEYYMGE